MKKRLTRFTLALAIQMSNKNAVDVILQLGALRMVISTYYNFTLNLILKY